jgi:hypothetical protein
MAKVELKDKSSTILNFKQAGRVIVDVGLWSPLYVLLLLESPKRDI